MFFKKKNKKLDELTELLNDLHRKLHFNKLDSGLDTREQGLLIKSLDKLFEQAFNNLDMNSIDMNEYQKLMTTNIHLQGTFMPMPAISHITHFLDSTLVLENKFGYEIFTPRHREFAIAFIDDMNKKNQF